MNRLKCDSQVFNQIWVFPVLETVAYMWKSRKTVKPFFPQEHQYFPFSSELNLSEKPVDVSFTSSQEHNCQMHSCIYLTSKKMKKTPQTNQKTRACTCNLQILNWVVSSKHLNYSVTMYLFFPTRKPVTTKLF